MQYRLLQLQKKQRSERHQFEKEMETLQQQKMLRNRSTNNLEMTLSEDYSRNDLQKKIKKLEINLEKQFKLENDHDND